MTERANIGEVTYGMDPEATLYKDGQLISASRVYRSLHAKIGQDGAGTPVEFRPDPSTNPEDLVKELEGLFKKVYKKGYDLSIHGNDVALGCHIHIGGAYVVENKVPIAKSLDEWIGEPFKTKNGRRRGQYAILYKDSTGAVRDQYYPNGARGIEYRALPSAVLYSPKLLLLIFTITDWVIHNLKSARCFRFESLEQWVESLTIHKIIKKSEQAEITTMVTNLPKCKRGSVAALITNELAQGKTPDEIQRDHGVSVGRIKSHIKHWTNRGFSFTSTVSAKTNVSNEIETELSKFFEEREISASMLKENWNLGRVNAKPPKPTFSRNDDWSGFPKIGVSRMSQFQGYHFIGLAPHRGEDAILNWNDQPKTIGIPRSWRDGSIIMSEVQIKMNEVAMRVAWSGEVRQ